MSLSLSESWSWSWSMREFSLEESSSFITYAEQLFIFKYYTADNFEDILDIKSRFLSLRMNLTISKSCSRRSWPLVKSFQIFRFDGDLKHKLNPQQILYINSFEDCQKLMCIALFIFRTFNSFSERKLFAFSLFLSFFLPGLFLNRLVLVLAMKSFLIAAMINECSSRFWRRN